MHLRFLKALKREKMATLNLTADNDVIVPSNDDTTYRGLGGNDT